MTDMGRSEERLTSAGETRLEREKALSWPGLDLRDVSIEILEIVGYLIAPDGPLAGASGLSSWHGRLLQKAMERLELIDGYLRGRVAFLVAGKGHGYDFFDTDLRIAAAALDSCRATTLVVETVLAGTLPSEQAVGAMGDAAIRIYTVLEAI